MSHVASLHEVLSARQSLAELKRKADKARNKSTFTQEGIDWANRYGLDMSIRLRYPRFGRPKLPDMGAP